MNETLINLFAAIGLSVTFSAIGGLLSWNLAKLWTKVRTQRRARDGQARAALAPGVALACAIQDPDCSDTPTRVDHIKAEM